MIDMLKLDHMPIIDQLDVSVTTLVYCELPKIRDID